MTLEQLKEAAKHAPIDGLRNMIELCQLQAITDQDSGKWMLREVVLRDELQRRAWG